MQVKYLKSTKKILALNKKAVLSNSTSPTHPPFHLFLLNPSICPRNPEKAAAPNAGINSLGRGLHRHLALVARLLRVADHDAPILHAEVGRDRLLSSPLPGCLLRLDAVLADKKPDAQHALDQLDLPG